MPPLKYRHIKGDMIEVYKILTNKYDSRVNVYLEKQQDSITSITSLKLVNNRYHYDLRKFSFAPRIVNVWNCLPEIVIPADTTDTVVVVSSWNVCSYVIPPLKMSTL